MTKINLGCRNSILLLIVVSGSLATIEKLELIMPRYAIKGGDVILKCDHSVPPEQLYKVEWQKGGSKIFQYIKGRQPPFRYFTIDGAVFNKAKSSEKQLQLSDLDFSASGLYSCVVSMDTPIFSKDSESHILTIIEPQEEDPVIYFNKKRYEFKETLEANCTTGPSRPPPHITWFINNKKVPDSLTKTFSNGKTHSRGHFERKGSTTRHISIEVSDLHVSQDGELSLTCMATIPAYLHDDEFYADSREHTVRIYIENSKREVEEEAVKEPIESQPIYNSKASRQSYLFKLIILFVIYVLL